MQGTLCPFAGEAVHRFGRLRRAPWRQGVSAARCRSRFSASSATAGSSLSNQPNSRALPRSLCNERLYRQPVGGVDSAGDRVASLQRAGGDTLGGLKTSAKAVDLGSPLTDGQSTAVAAMHSLCRFLQH